MRAFCKRGRRQTCDYLKTGAQASCNWRLHARCAILSRKLIEEFGGRAEKWPRDWLKRFADLHKSKPLKIGKRLLISTTAHLQRNEGPPRSRDHASYLNVTHRPTRVFFIVWETQDNTQQRLALVSLCFSSFQLLPLSGQENTQRRQCRFVSSNA